ncbi:MAG: hypothetical protein NC409_00255 [Clostridium sp.]|nr:hypothetical protein [Clostridium sp.]
MTEKKYRILVDEENDSWDRVSFWTSADDVECTDGNTIEAKISKLQSIYLTDTLTAGNTSITFINDAITEDCIIDLYTNVYGVSPKTVDDSVAGQLVLTFEEQEKDIRVRIKITEI